MKFLKQLFDANGRELKRPAAGANAASDELVMGDDTRLVVAPGRIKSATLTPYSMPGVILNGTQSTLSMATNRLYHQPMYLAAPVNLDRIGADVSTGLGGGTFRVGIYAANTDWQPTSLVLDAGLLSSGATAVVTATINQNLSAGRYLLVYVTGGSAVLRTFESINSDLHTTPTTKIQSLYRSFTFAALPAPSNWDTVGTGGNFLNTIFVRIASFL